MSKYTTSTTGNVGQSAECQYQKHALQVVYVRAYVEITRLLAQYETLIHSNTCDDYVWETEGGQEKILEGKLVKMTTTVSSYTHKLEAYRSRIEHSMKLEGHLRQEITLLAQRCGEMEATVSSLDKVRDAIEVMGVCPGLGRITFVVPRYSGEAPIATFDLVNLTDAQIDQRLNNLCVQTLPTPAVENGMTQLIRAAETSEFMLRSVDELPSNNIASVPLIGTCPNCEGDDDQQGGPQHVSGHSRVCWDPSAQLDASSKRTDCTGWNGRKAVMCVSEVTYAD
jgi:hypothetical protein